MRVTLIALLVLAAGIARADNDPIGSKLYPPDLVMAHQQELGIDDKQRDAIVKEIQKAQAQITEAQWQLQAATEELARDLDVARVDEAKALAQAEKVMNLERAVKTAHLGMLIRVKNLLTEAQRAKLNELRRRGAN